MRADRLLVERGLCGSRTLAAQLIREGYVRWGEARVEKPSQELPPEAELSVLDNPLTRYVSRGGLKLEAALEGFGVDPRGLVCADVGASTGGFTDCLLQRGAKLVFAVDSGTAQLHPRLRGDERVRCLENTNARYLTGEEFEKADLVVMDVSFISQALLYPALCRVLKPRGRLIALIKPQFEAGREHLDKHGLVKSEAVRRAVVERLRDRAKDAGLALLATLPSPLLGGDGNHEILALFERIEA